MTLSAIVAIAQNRAIGKDNKLLWHLPNDLKHFKIITSGHTIIMGRKTYDSVGRPLPNRRNIVVTRQEGYQPEGVLVFHDIDAALEKAREIAVADGVDEIMIIGGGELYAQLMPLADRLYITHIDLSPEGDVRFPVITPEDWAVVDLPEVTPSPKDEATYRVKVYARRKGSAH